MTRVLAIDDSATMRRIIQSVLETVPGLQVHLARSGEEALEMLPRIQPDVITLDIIMTGMDGLELLSRIMSSHPLPVVMISSLTSNGASATLTALSLGAVDFIQKPRGPLAPDLEPFRSELINTVRTASRARVRSAPPPSQAPVAPSRTSLREPAAAPQRPRAARTGFPLAVVGASTGGPPALEEILSSLPGDLGAAVLVAQHMPAGFTSAFASRLDRRLAMKTEEVSGTVQVQPGHIYIARGEADMVLTNRQGQLFACSVDSDPDLRWHPSVDRLTRSAMQAVDPRRLVGVLATGMGDDGAAAMTELRRRGGQTIAEAQKTAVVWGMPRALVEAGGADQVQPLHRIGPALLDLLR